MHDPPRDSRARPALAHPSRYSPALARRICDAVSTGTPLAAVCAAADMPDRETLARWLDAHADFRSAYTRALEAAADRYADEILTIADASASESPGAGKSDAGSVARAKLRIDTRKWLMSRLAPSKYGERPAASAAARLSAGTTNLHDLSDAEIDDILSAETEPGEGTP
jgi:Bacteriophage Sf6, terminase small subunit-like